MSNNVPITQGVGTPIETQQQPGGEHRQVMSMENFAAVLHGLLQQLAAPSYVDPANQRMRVVIDSITNGLTLSTITTVSGVTTVTTVATVTTVGTVTNLAQIGARAADEVVVDIATAAWANSLRGRVA